MEKFEISPAPRTGPLCAPTPVSSHPAWTLASGYPHSSKAIQTLFLLHRGAFWSSSSGNGAMTISVASACFAVRNSSETGLPLRVSLHVTVFPVETHPNTCHAYVNHVRGVAQVPSVVSAVSYPGCLTSKTDCSCSKQSREMNVLNATHRFMFNV